MALKSPQTWSVSRHANDLPSYEQITSFYDSEQRAEAISRGGDSQSERSERERGSEASGRTGKSTGPPPTSSTETAPTSTLAAEIAVVEAFVRRLDAIVGALQTQMEAYDPGMPRTELWSGWREVNDRVTKSLLGDVGSEVRERGSSPSTKHEPDVAPVDDLSHRSPRRKKRRKQQGGRGPTIATLPLYVNGHWLAVASDVTTRSVLVYDAGHVLEPGEAEIVAGEAMRAVSDGEETYLNVRHIRPPNRVPRRHSVVIALATLETLSTSPTPTNDPALHVILALWSKLVAQGVTLAIPPSFDKPAAAQSAMYTKNILGSRVLRDRVVWTIHTGTLACPFRGYW